MTTNLRGLRLIFAGTPQFAARHLQALLSSHHEVVAVYTQPDRPAGRGKKLTASPVKTLALSHHIPVFQPSSLKTREAQRELSQHQADVMVVVAYGLLLPQAVLDTPRHGCLNVHGSLLPRWRGAAPIQRAILGENSNGRDTDKNNAIGDTETGITIMQMDQGLDTGAMLHKSHCPIAADETTASLHDKLVELGPPALLTVLDQVQNQQLMPERQNDADATYAEKISKEEARINWNLPAETIERKIRAYNPFPVAYTFISDKRVKIYTANVLKQTVDQKPGMIVSMDERGLVVACERGALSVQYLQLPGKKSLSVADIANGNDGPFIVGHYFE